jgi:serine-type D-Ala-D-Ala carboxypeptidase (penicillin-binding protein 5/6)
MRKVMRTALSPILSKAVLVLALLTSPSSADVQIPEALKSRIPAPELEAVSWVLQDQKSGWIIDAKEPDLRVEPASISKLMTAYVVFDELAKGNLKGDDLVLISERAWRMEGSRMFVDVNSRVSVDELLKGLIVQSGNDAAVALAEHVAGSESGFVEVMNQTARRLGLTGSNYRNSTGLPHPEHYSTARDISELTRALIRDFPQYYELYSIRSYSYNDIEQRNRNVLLWRDDDVDGVKTGHTSSAGYCLVGSAEKAGMRLISTVMGTASTKYRSDAVYALLTHGFSAYEGFLIYDRDKPIATPRVYKGDGRQLEVVVDQPLYVTVAKGGADGVKARMSFDEPLVAPIATGTRVGHLSLTIGEQSMGEYPLVARQDMQQGSWFTSLMDSVKLMFH